MPAGTLMFKVEGMTQASQLPALAGKSFTVGKVAAAGKGVGNWLFLDPVQTAVAGQSSVAIKIEGTRQIAQLSGLVGKTVTIGQSPTVIGGAGKWLVMHSGSGIVAASGGAIGTGIAAGGSLATPHLVLMKLEGGRRAVQGSMLAGKTFTVIPPPMVGAKTTGWVFLQPVTGAAGKGVVAVEVQGATAATTSSLVGKTFTVAHAPMAGGNAGHWLVLNPVGGLAGKGAAVAAVANTQSATVAMVETAAPAGKSAAVGAAEGTAPAGGKAMALKNAAGGAGKQGLAGKAAAAVSKGTTGTIWKGTGMSLGLGLGLGAWGPVLLAGMAAAVVGVGIYGYKKKQRAAGELEELTA